MHTPKMIALDIDGTLFNQNGEITPYTRQQITSAVHRGIPVVLSTGRPYVGLPLKDAAELGIEYAITSNGAAIYHIPDRKCLSENGFDPETAADLLRRLSAYRLHIDAFIDGYAYTQTPNSYILMHSALPDSVKKYVTSTRETVPDLASYIEENHYILEKITMHFEMISENCFVDRDEVYDFLLSTGLVRVVCGGYHNLEFTKTGVTKAAGLAFLCDYLQISTEDVLACGDSENDLDILMAAGISVAMGNACDDIKNICDDVTASCDDDGVGHAIAKYITN